MNLHPASYPVNLDRYRSFIAAEVQTLREHAHYKRAHQARQGKQNTHQTNTPNKHDTHAHTYQPQHRHTPTHTYIHTRAHTHIHTRAHTHAQTHTPSYSLTDSLIHAQALSREILRTQFIVIINDAIAIHLQRCSPCARSRQCNTICDLGGIVIVDILRIAISIMKILI
jgi:hypothetical protein